LTKRSPCVLHGSAELRWQFFIIDERKKLLPDRARTVANNFHLGKRRRRQNRFEEPEDPRHKRGDIHEELARLVSYIRSELHWNWKMTPWHTYEELRIVVLEYGRDRRGGSFRVCRAAAEGDTLIVCFTKSQSIPCARHL
jgi:hypothetical protein